MVMALATLPACATTISASVVHCFQSRAIAYSDFLEQNLDGTHNNMNPIAQIYLSSKSNNEVYTLREMLQQPDRDKFVDAMREEVHSMFKQEIWKSVPKAQILQHYQQQREGGTEIRRHQIMMIWSFKRKRHPDGSLNKHKARLCCHGGQQEWGINFWDTYAPVVAWSSVRILLTISKLHNLSTKSVDFVQAYPQALVKSVIFLKTPPGVQLSNDGGEKVLRLVRNLYGLKDAGRTWFQHLSAGLDAMGFIPTQSDPCVFIRRTSIIILYVDDCIIIDERQSETNKVFEELQTKGFKLTDEGTMESYLGLQFDHHSDGSFRMSQPMLVDRIIAAIPGMDSARSAKSPATAGVVLTKDETGDERAEQWHYRSVVGMMNYLVNCTQPDLSFAVHQCARFCEQPKRTHEQAMKRIVRYLLHTKRTNEQGIVYRPDKNKSIDAFVDASFAGD